MFHLENRHFLKLLDLSPAEIEGLLDLAADLKEKKKNGVPHRFLAGKNIALIFEKTSTRTRCSFEVAAHDLGMQVTYLDPAETGQKYIDLLRRVEKCDLVICLSHLGWDVSVYPDERFLSLTDGCDLVLGGHTHTYMPTLEFAPDKSGKRIPVDQNGKHGAFVGKLVLDLQKR